MKQRRSSSMRLLSSSLLLSALLFAGCSPIGSGIGPVRLVVNGPTGAADASNARIFECIRSGLSATLFFSDGSAGDFTSRVRWTSSNPAVVRVSNGDEPAPAPSTGFFGFGIMTPVAPGTAIVTATYLGLSDSIEISVGTPTNITVHEISTQTALPFDPPNNAFRIGPGTNQGLTVTGMLDGVENTLDSAATWSFDAPDTTVATISATTGVVIGVAAGGPLVARASFSPCTLSASTSVSVAPIQSISIVPEFASANLFVGTSELFRVLADFGDGPEQDISLSSQLSSSNPTAAPFNTGVGITNLLNAIAAAGPIDIGASFNQGGTIISAPTVPLTTVSGTLDSIAVTPATASVVAGSNQVAQFTVTGTYAGGTTQDITRLAGWTSSDPTIGQIAAGAAQPAMAGQARSTGTTPGSTTLTATVAAATTTPTATATLTTTAPPTSP